MSGGLARSYAADGSTTALNGTAKQFTYDDIGRMQQAKNGSTLVMNYRYNGRGERTRAYLGSANTYTLYDEAGHWLGDYGNNGTVIQQAIWMDDLPVGVVTTAKTHYLQPDHLGTPRAVIDPASNKAIWSWSIRGEAFGATAPNEDPDQDGQAFVFNLRFPGQRYDAASGLNYNYFRDYEPGTGRYVQSDPIGIRGGISTYGYVSASPFRFIDPLGLENVWDTTTCGGQLGLTTCDGKGGFLVSNCNTGCDRSCTQAHEEDHVRILTERYPNACMGRPRGAAPFPMSWNPNSSEYRALYQEMECRADTVTINCIKKSKGEGVTSPSAEKNLLYALNRRRNRRCDLYGY